MVSSLQIKKSITSGSNYFEAAKSFGVICDSDIISFYLLETAGNYGKISQFDSNWKFLNYYNVLRAFEMLAIPYGLDYRIIVTTQYGIYKLDRNFNFLRFYYDFNANYSSMYYNSSADLLFVCSGVYRRIDIFDQSLTFKKSIFISSFSPKDIKAYDDFLYVSTSSKYIFVYRDQVNIQNITTNCGSGITSSIIDQSGNLAILCSNIIHIYSRNGTYLGASWKSTIPNLSDMSFDNYGNLVLVATNGIFIMNNETRPINNTGISLDTSCIVNSNSKIKFTTDFQLIYIEFFFRSNFCRCFSKL